MNLYKDGQFVETFKQSRDLDILQKYLADHAEPTTPLSPPVPEITDGAKTEEVPVVPAVPAKVYNPSGSVTVLNEKTFADAVQEGHIFIKYYAPWYVFTWSLISLAHRPTGAVTVRSLRLPGWSWRHRCATSSPLQKSTVTRTARSAGVKE